MNVADLSAAERLVVAEAAAAGGWLTDTSSMAGAADPSAAEGLAAAGVFERVAPAGQVPRWVLTVAGRALAEQL